MTGATARGVFELLGREVPAVVPALNWPDGLDESAFGNVYQIRQMLSRKALQKRIQQADKQTSKEDLIAFTQLYTPDWVVRFLIERSLCDGGSVLDPACGSGHFLLSAVEHLSSSTDIKSALTSITGCDIDPVGIEIARLALTIKAARHLPLDEIPSLDLRYVGDHPLGSLAPSAIPGKFDAVVGNPPYVGRKLMDRALKQQLKEHYPNSHSDLCAAFVERGLQLLNDGGRLAYITQSSLLYLPSYSSFRKHILDNHHLDVVVEAGPHVFPLQSGEKVNSVLLVIQNGRNSSQSNWLDLTESNDKANDLLALPFTERDQTHFYSFRGHAFNFGCPPSFAVIMQGNEKLGNYADIRQGLATTDNARFVRRIEDVPQEEIGTRWFPYAMGGGSERWFAPIGTVVDWEDNGAAIKKCVAEKYPYLNGKVEWVVKNEQYYFREGLTFSFVNSKNLAVRWLPPGCIFDVGGSALFSDEHFFLLAYLNSSFIAQCARYLNPTINFQVGDLKELPYIKFSYDARQELAGLAQTCLRLKRAAAHPELSETESSINRIIDKHAKFLLPS